MKEFKEKLIKKLYTTKKLNKEEKEYMELVLGRDCPNCGMCRFNMLSYLGEKVMTRGGVL